ncbi:MAG: hypothetical protein KC505_11195 [Myxococcales bacterium]|nr:hypothetical protein [Myxococcales bacterium]
MSELIKKHAVSGSALALAIAMGLQSFVFGNNDILVLKETITSLSERIAKLEQSRIHD